ncbi:glycoside hydrolase family 47 protein [Lanmaoa asiatica]|nr:glycoside hydrolase family 47 protein [Lanmaoa asiatica]
MTFLSSLRYVPGTHISIHPPRRGITIRHVVFVLAFSVALWTLYHSYLKQSEALFPQEHVVFWPPETPEIWADRAAQVKNAFVHAYHGYEHHAFPHDELRPISNTSVDSFNGWGVTAVDSLDTMLLMGLQDEYLRAIPMISATNFSLPTNTNVPFFETVIRYLGGLLSAYALSTDNILRDKADELAIKLSPRLQHIQWIPPICSEYLQVRRVYLHCQIPAIDILSSSSGSSRPQLTSAVLAEIASFQMEYAYLGKITGKKEHVDRATMVTNIFHNTNLSLSGGMYPTYWDLHNGKPTNLRLSVGAAADSAHEYTLKQFLLTARSDRVNMEMYLRFTTHVINNLLYISSQRQLLYVTDSTTNGNRTATSHSFEHLSCFFPGLLALGAHLLPLSNLETIGINITQLSDDLPPKHRQGYEALAEFDLADLHLWAAEGIAQMCYLSYADQPSGLGPDVVAMRIGKSGELRWMDAMQEWKAGGQLGSPPGVGDKRPWVGNPRAKDSYYLRPEAVESFYILWRTTGDVKWRHRGWSVFQAIERVAKTPSGYANVDRVHSADPILRDLMPSYFLAETLKYLYLLFLDDDIVPLEKWVFNTEAHPLPVFAWTELEKETYYNVVQAHV